VRGKLHRWFAPVILGCWATAALGQDAPRPPVDPALQKRVAEARETGVWVVREGDTVFRVSRLFATDESDAKRFASDLEALNPSAFVLNDPGRLAVGATLRIPDRYRAAAAATRPASTRPTTPQGAAGQHVFPFDVTVNGKKSGTWLFVEIAGELYVGVQTVKTHVGNVLAKLGARDRTQAVIRAYDSGFVTPSR